jgi:hypothetical protein
VAGTVRKMQYEAREGSEIVYICIEEGLKMQILHHDEV